MTRAISRRAAFGGAAAFAVPALSASADEPNPDAALIDLCRRFVANDSEQRRLADLAYAADDNERTEEGEALSLEGAALMPAYCAMMQEVVTVPAHTQEGLQAKAEVLLRTTDNEDLVRSVVWDIFCAGHLST
ncbi:MAG TPA: hypothetical protein VGN83_22140 [Falsiroseomonas sp.]|jgi:hypothetical protein|nr:hypothetical protein [Falsiroseomonas sp.]